MSTPLDLSKVVGKDKYAGPDYPHCGVCPRANHESCTLPCTTVRADLTSADGVKVDYPT